MKTLWRTRRDSLMNEHMPPVDQTLAASLPARGPKPVGTGTGTGTEHAARPLRPVAHWVSMPASGGGSRLEMIWETSTPLPAALAG